MFAGILAWTPSGISVTCKTGMFPSVGRASNTAAVDGGLVDVPLVTENVSIVFFIF